MSRQVFLPNICDLSRFPTKFTRNQHLIWRFTLYFQLKGIYIYVSLRAPTDNGFHFYAIYVLLLYENHVRKKNAIGT